MSNNSPPGEDEVPELTPDNGSVTSSSSFHSSDGQRVLRSYERLFYESFAAQGVDFGPFDPRHVNFTHDSDDSNPEAFDPRRFTFAEDSDGSSLENHHPSSSAVNASHGAARRPLRERLRNLITRGEPRSRGPVRPSDRSNPDVTPARGYWDSPHFLAVPEFRDTVASQQQSEEDELYFSSQEQQGSLPERAPRAPRVRGMESRSQTPIGDIPSINLGPCLVPLAAAASPAAAEPMEPNDLNGQASAARDESTSAEQHITTGPESGDPVSSNPPQGPADQPQQAEDAPARPRGFLRGAWERMRNRKHREPSDEQKQKGTRIFFWRRRPG